MKKTLLFIFAILACCTTFCQPHDKNFANSIKKNAEYLYAENADSIHAFAMLMEKVRNYQNSEMQTDTTILFVRSKAEHFSYQKNSHTKVVLYYVLKKDLLIPDTQEVPENLTAEITNENCSVIDNVIRHKKYSALNSYLEQRKYEKHDIQFKLIRGDDGTRNCYWIVFDNNKNIIAILDTSLSIDLLTGKSVDFNDYVKLPKIWLQIF